MKRKPQQQKKNWNLTAYHWTHSGSSQKQKRQLGRFLNRYYFAYARRDKINEAVKVVPGVIKAATNDINNIAEKITNQKISEGGKEIELVLPKILRGAIEHVYQTPFRLLSEFGKKKFNSIKIKILK